MENLLFPALIAVLGFIGKSGYEIWKTNRDKKIELLQNRLQKFYWPILIRIEKDNAIWETILSKREDPQSLQFRVADHVEKEYVLRNHDEILEIISSNMYLAEPDAELSNSINKYIKNVTIYKALRESGEERVFPLELGAEWPQDFHQLISDRTSNYQAKLNRMLMS